MKKLTAFIVLASLAFGAMAFAQAAKFKKIAKNGTANIVFSNSKIEKGKESAVTLKNKFTDSEVIWARAYFPKTFGTLEGEAEGFMDMWIDGQNVKRLAFTNKDIPAGNDQMMIYVHNTDNDDFKDDVWSAIEPGEHKIKIVVGKTEFLKAKIKLDVEGDDLVAKNDDAYKAVYLAESDFIYIKK